MLDLMILLQKQVPIAVLPSLFSWIPNRFHSSLCFVLMNLLSKVLPLFFVVCCFTGCETVSDLVTTSLPHTQSGKTSIVISLHEQRAYLRKGKDVISEATISTGREGHATPVGHFHVIRKDRDHRSGLYGDYVDASGRIVRANVDLRKDSRPPGSHYLGASMPFFVEFSPGFGLHEGNRPGYPASHGCVRLSYWKARQFYDESRIGTPVTVQP
jgi:hypothetical protein